MISRLFNKKLSREHSVFLGTMLMSMILGLASIQIFQALQKKGDLGCSRMYQVELTPETPQVLSGITEYDTACYHFEAQAGQSLSITTNTFVTLLSPDGGITAIQDGWSQSLTMSGQYYLKIEQNPYLDDDFFIELSTFATVNSDRVSSNIGSTSAGILDFSGKLRSPEPTSLQTTPPFADDFQLKAILDQAIVHVERRGLPLDKLSISLVKLTSESCCGYAGFNDNYPRYPASVAKLFWLVNLYAQYENGILSPGTVSESDIRKMIADSDNEPASRVLDLVTQTESGTDLSTDELERWMDKRFSINRYFEERGYHGVNLSQKTFPIPYLQLNGPQGRELQMRGKPTQPIRNHLTTHSTARLLYEIFTNQAVSSTYSQRIQSHLKRDLSPASWQGRPFNSIEGFLGESLPPSTSFYSKAGWMSISRNDAAVIVSPDGETKYILVVFGDDKAFMDDDEIFPAISREIYQSLANNL